MTVAELAHALSRMNPNDLVVLASDARGSTFAALDETDASCVFYYGVFVDENDEEQRVYHGHIKYRWDDPNRETLTGLGVDDERFAEEGDGGLRCVVLWPVR